MMIYVISYMINNIYSDIIYIKLTSYLSERFEYFVCVSKKRRDLAPCQWAILVAKVMINMGWNVGNSACSNSVCDGQVGESMMITA